MAKKNKNDMPPPPPGVSQFKARKGLALFALIAVGLLIAVAVAPSSDSKPTLQYGATTPAGIIESAITKEAGKSSSIDGAGGKRVKYILVSNMKINIEIYGDENLSGGLTKSANRRLVLDVIKAVQVAKVGFHEATIKVFYPLVDKLGNTTIDEVLSYTFTGGQLMKINTGNIDTHNMDSGFADVDQFIHPAFAW
jgi:hypothetical protein